MKILSYNIFNGGRTRSRDRTKELVSIIREADPDIVGLCECSGFRNDDRARLREFETELGMRAVINRAPSGHHVAILCSDRVSIKDVDVGEAMMYHGFASVVADIPGVGRTAIVMAHLHPRSSVFRMGEAQTVLGKAVTEPNAIAMGDFNSPASYDALVNLEGLSRDRRIRLSNVDNSAAFDVPGLFKSCGFVDLGEEDAAPTFPTTLDKRDGGRGPRLRLDYMFATPPLAKIARLTTLATPLTMFASDHLPLLCELLML